MRPTRPLYFMLNLAGSGHDFRGVCFSVAYTTPNGKSCRSFPQTRSIYHNSCCAHPLKRSQTRSDAKNTKRQENTRPNQKNASESFSGVCITIHESDARSVSTVQKRERVKTANFLIQKTPHGTRNFSCPVRRWRGSGCSPGYHILMPR